MRSVWNGTISFGQVAIPVKAYSATEPRGSGLHQLHVTDGGRIKLRRTCEIDGEDVPFAELGKGFELPDGDVVVLTQEDMAGLPLAASHSIEVCAFAPLEQIDPLYFDRSYYLEPEPAGTKPYVLFGEALRQTGKVAVVRVALRRRETLAMLRERDNVIVLTTMLWPSDIRVPRFPFLREDVEVRMRELRSAVADVQRLSADFDPSRFADEYQEALYDLVNERAGAGDVVRPTATAQDTAATELVAALRDGADRATTGRAVDEAKVAVGKAAAAKAEATRAAHRATAKRRTAKA